MKITKDHIIEGQIIPAGTEIVVLEEAVVTPKDKADFIVNHINMANEYELLDLYNALFRAKFKDDTGSLIMNDKRGSWYNDSLEFKISDKTPYEEVRKAFEDHLEAGSYTGDSRWETEVLGPAMKGIYTDSKRPDIYKMNTYGGGSVDSLLRVIDYVVNGEKSPDRGKYLGLVDKYEMNKWGVDSYDVEIPEIAPGLRIKKFKNGNHKVFGLNNSEIGKVNELIDRFN